MPAAPRYKTALLSVVLRVDFLQSLREWHAQSNGLGTFESFLAELLESIAADFRLKQIEPHFPMPPPGLGVPHIPGSNGHRRYPLSPEKVQRIIFLREREGLSVDALAVRFKVCKGTVSRILKAHERAEHVKTPGHASGNANWCKQEAQP
jgi:hypothetical protein